VTGPGNDAVRFTLDGREMEAQPGESILEAVRRHGVELPHMCSGLNPGYRADGNCRLCLVEIEGERALAPSCLRQPSPGMAVRAAAPRAERARRLVMELLLADQPERKSAFAPAGRFRRLAERMGVTASRFPPRAEAPPPDASHPAIAVNLDACIHCTNCVRACREEQDNDVIGMAGRGGRTRVVFDQGDALQASTCVACGECVQACPTGALLPAGLPEQAATRVVPSICPYCGVGCQITWHVADGRILYAEGRHGPANRGRLCVKGRFGFDYVRHPHRLTVPLIRREGMPKRGDDRVDPADPSTHFRPASWDEALARAADGLKRIRARDGGAALAGFGSAKGSNEEAYLFQKLVRTGFGTNNVDHCTRLCHASSVAALMEGIGSGAVTAPFTAALDSDVILVVGARPTENHPVAATFFKNAKRRGATLIVIDPRRQGLSRLADFHLQFRPGTDVALLDALLNVVVEEGLANRDYVARFTEGFAELRERVKNCTPERMAPLCGVDAATLREVARRYATARRAIIFWGMGISQHVHGTDNARCLIALALVTGQVGRPGTGLHPLRGQNNVQGASDMGLIPMVYPDYRPVEDAATRARYEALWGTALDPRRGLTVVEILEAAREGRIKGMYIMGENPAMSDPDVVHARAALAALEHLVVQDIFLTETAWHADVVLPASAFPEKSGTFTNTNRQVQLGRPALDPPGEARPDWWIIQEMAHRLGLQWSYAGPAEVFAEFRTLIPGLAGITWERLEREDAVAYPCLAEDQPGRDILFGDGFPTPNGRGRIVPADLTPPDEPPDAEYPFVLTTGRLLEHWHTGAITRRARVLDALEPAPVACLHPEELDRLGAAPGGTIEVTTRRGCIRLSARADREVPPGVVFIPFCYAEAPANLLTNPKLDPFGKIPGFKACAARVARAGGQSRRG
jgi:formate dehydrogenase major subunit